MAGLVIVGAGGFGREVLRYCRDAGIFHVEGFVDDNPHALDGHDCGTAVIGSPRDASLLAGHVVIAIGDPEVRSGFRCQVEAFGGTLASVIHPTSWVAPEATIGAGSIIAPGAYVSVGAVLGRNVVVNALASVGHDVRVGDDSVISPHAALSGAVYLGDSVLIGTGAAATPGVRIGARARVAAGACATRDVPEAALAVGNPARSRVMYAGK